MRRGRSALWVWRAVVFAVGIGLGFLQASKCFSFLRDHGFDSPIRVDGEIGSLATYGKWWVLPPHNYLTDGFSGELPAYYNYVYDTLVNLVAALGDWPSLTVHVVLMGPILAVLFFWANVASLRFITQSRTAGLVGAVLLSLSGASHLLRLFFGPETAGSIGALLHVPVTARVFGTSQALGWVLFMPTLAVFYAAHTHFTRCRGISCGLLTGLMLHVHSLTFVNLVCGQVAYATLVTGMRLGGGRRRQLWLVGLSVLAVSFIVRFTSAPVPTITVGAFGAAVLLTNVAASPVWRLYGWIYGVAGLTAAPYLMALLRGRGPGVLADPIGGATVGLGVLLAFYASHVLAGLLVLRGQAPRPALAFLFSLLAATWFLSESHLWGWGNHPYRFAINLIFPLSALAALGLTHGPRRLAVPAALWLGVIVAANVWRLAASGQGAERFRAYGELAPRLLAGVRSATAALPSDSRLLNWPEYDYPQGVRENTQLLSFSRRPGFIPDYRYLLDRERYFNRLGVFCFLFPDYPAVDRHLGDRRACEEQLDPPPDLLRIREPRLRAGILAVYGLQIAASLGPPFADVLERAEGRYGWLPLATFGQKRRLVRLDPPDLPGVARLRRSRQTALGQAIPFDVASAGDHLFVLGGRSLSDRVGRIQLDNRSDAAASCRQNWVVLRAPLQAGRHELLLGRRWPEPGDERDALYFVAIVEGRVASRYIELGQASLEAPERQ